MWREVGWRKEFRARAGSQELMDRRTYVVLLLASRGEAGSSFFVKYRVCTVEASVTWAAASMDIRCLVSNSWTLYPKVQPLKGQESYGERQTLA